MCGFAGRVVPPGCDAGGEVIIRSVSRALEHRGPDDEGVIVEPGLQLVHRRLSIIDLSSAARQPMTDPSGRFTLVYNGEIYNFRALASRHLRGESRLNGAGDTAVLLALLMSRGSDILGELDGMFAFSLVDRHKRSVLLARDRFGEKPLYWAIADGGLSFASELSALGMLTPGHSRKLDRDAVLLFHCLGSIPAPRSIYASARALEAGSWLEWTPESEPKLARYWEAKSLVSDLQEPRLSDRRAREQAGAELQAAVRSRLVSDVPVGLFLSGGMDSTSLLAIYSRLELPRLTALCIDFEDSSFSEFATARISADTYGADLHRCVVTAPEFAGELNRFFGAMDQPTTDGFNTHFVSRAAARLGIKVWLTGLGGDELFGGYPSFRRLGPMQTLSRLLQGILPARLLRRASSMWPHWPRIARLAHLAVQGPPSVRAYQCLRNIMPWMSLPAVLNPELLGSERLAPELLDSAYPLISDPASTFDAASLFELQVYMRSQLLRDIDNFSMTHSIELRAPFLSPSLARSVFAAPGSLKQAYGRTKPLLAESLNTPLPRAVIDKPKMGFTFPVRTWLREEMRRQFQETVLDPLNADIWNLPAVEQIWNAYVADRVHWSIPWLFFALAGWRRAHDAYL